ncbi:Ger(x)C family spore germination protein [Paenibacillus sinopodophylli]|uniref:Ger(x)C family spore germination protein n=1 Tax=Paenibacillus sinopodophylli TaxID=1837342 RepID=UPI00110D0602|nr:Ger(x)C family spore germination protein [Paenibacillus sinopodophylli]
MKQNRSLFCIAALITCLCLLTGCWDRKEMDDLALVMASGVDLAEDGQLEVTLQIALPSGISSSSMSIANGGKPVFVVSAKGKDGIEAFGRLQQQLSRRINLGHRGVIVIGENYAKHGINQVLDTLLRSPDSRYNSYIVTSYGMTAKEILNSPYSLELIPAIGINKVQNNNFSISVKSDEFINDLTSNGKTSITGAIRIINKDSKQKTFLIDKAAVYQKNTLVGFFSGSELQVFRILKGHFKSANLTEQMTAPSKLFKGTVSLQFTKAKTKIIATISDGKPALTISLNVTANVLANDTSLDLSKAANLKLIEASFSNIMKKTIMTMVERSQKKFKSDVLDMGNIIHIQHPYYWKTIKHKWETIYTSVPVTIKTKIQIERIGRTQAPPYQQRN